MEGIQCTKKTLGRRRIPIQKIEKKSSRNVAFSKRRTGLFKKAMELSILCDVDVALIAFSEAGKAFTFGNPDSLFHRYMQRSQNQYGNMQSQNKDCGNENAQNQDCYEVDAQGGSSSCTDVQNQDFRYVGPHNQYSCTVVQSQNQNYMVDAGSQEEYVDGNVQCYDSLCDIGWEDNIDLCDIGWEDNIDLFSSFMQDGMGG